MNNLPKVVTQQRRGRASNPRLIDRKSDALPLSHRACPLGNLSLLDLVINRFFTKMFNTSKMDIVKSCQLHFTYDMPSTLWPKL